MLRSVSTVTCGYSISGLHNRTIHTGRLAPERMLKETMEIEGLVKGGSCFHVALFMPSFRIP